ncbi:hypothetical protein B9Z55_007368 [Caenorhabditis nigoni]|uniref:Uncharacterized protein n=1 Tax=Caenorhabditis nigoni TaxID=1611254 RepID=A0A2G5V9B1_9PELO|nr:hypothetical protein B9Z55_007368 [Caenorhabditis nigoni]
MTISDVSPKKPSSAFPKLPDGWKESLYRELDSGSLEFPLEDVEALETSVTDDDVTRELSLDNLLVAEAKIGAPDLSVLVEEASEDVSEVKESSEDVQAGVDPEADYDASEDGSVAQEHSEDVADAERDSEGVQAGDVEPESDHHVSEDVTDEEEETDDVSDEEEDSEDVTVAEEESEDVADAERDSEGVRAGEADHNTSDDVADEYEESEDVTVAEDDSEDVNTTVEDSEAVNDEEEDSEDVPSDDVALEDVDVSYLDRMANEIILKQLHEESEALALEIQIPADKAVDISDISAEDPPAPPMYIQRMQNLLHQQIRRFLSYSLVLQCQNAAENAKIALENQENLDWNELTASAMIVDDASIPTRFQSQFSDFRCRFSALKAHMLIIQCQNASRRALEAIPERYSEWDSEATWDSEETLLIRLEADFKLPDEIERLKHDIHVAIDTYKALLLVPESQMSSQNARLPLASCQKIQWNLTSKTAEFPLKTSEILPESVENELESLSEQFEAFRRLQMVVMGQKASESATMALESAESAESAEIETECVEPMSLISEESSSSSDSVGGELPAIQEAFRRRRTLLAYQDLIAFYNYSQGAGFFDNSSRPVHIHLGAGLTLIRHVNPIHRHVADRNARDSSNRESEEEEEDSVD